MTSTKKTETDIIPFRSNQKQVENDADRAELGKWYWVHKEEDGSPSEEKWLGCVTRVGTNFVEIKGPADSARSTRVTRVHFDNFWQWCEAVDGEEADKIIDGNIAHFQSQTRGLMEEVRGLTARLSVTQRQALEDGGNPEAKALSIRLSEPVDTYKKDLVKAKEETLPDLFEKIKRSNEMMATWMQVKLAPLEAEAETLKGSVDLVKDRIFSVELYAGLVEEATRVRDGAPAHNDTQVHLMQRRAYMDEECLVGYEHGGMDYKSIDDFERWLCKPANFNRLFPYARTLLAFQVRRFDKKREVSLVNFIQVMNEKRWDKTTFLYVRNGEQLWRIATEIEFEDHLFPDGNNKLFASNKLWAKKSFLRNIDDVITDEEHQGKIEDEKAEVEKLKKIPEKEHWRHRNHTFDTSDQYQPFTPDNVYFDDIMSILEKEKKKHNQLVLVMQGILDRSPMLMPHPPWQLWTPEGFSAAFKLIYDATRALSAGDKPDFEAYRVKLNSYLVSGSVTVGQEEAWEIREAERYNRQRAEDSSSGHFHEYERYRPSGDPGPGMLAVVSRYAKKNHSVTYDWTRSGRRYPYKEDVPATLTTGQENVLNVDAYKPGDFHIFFDDPRTRQEYLVWAPMLLEAEECHAGNRAVKPNKLLPPIPHGEYIPTEERPVDLKFVEKEKAPPIADRYVSKKVSFNFDMQTQGGTKFREGEIATITSYSRKMVSLTVTDGKEKKSIRNVHINHVTLLGE